MDFKIGDIVIRIATFEHAPPVGSVGVVTELLMHGGYRVDFGGKFNNWECNPETIEHYDDNLIAVESIIEEV